MLVGVSDGVSLGVLVGLLVGVGVDDGVALGEVVGLLEGVLVGVVDGVLVGLGRARSPPCLGCSRLELGGEHKGRSNATFGQWAITPQPPTGTGYHRKQQNLLPLTATVAFGP